MRQSPLENPGVDPDLPASPAGAAPGSGFKPPAQPEWHRMIAEAAYFQAQKRGFARGGALDDWLLAEQEISRLLKHQSSVVPGSES
jgi:hypothetical protein